MPSEARFSVVESPMTFVVLPSCTEVWVTSNFWFASKAASSLLVLNLNDSVIVTLVVLVFASENIVLPDDVNVKMSRTPQDRRMLSLSLNRGFTSDAPEGSANSG